jgi:hypothetical protein
MEKVIAAGIGSISILYAPLIEHVILAVEIPQGVYIVHPPIFG